MRSTIALLVLLLLSSLGFGDVASGVQQLDAACAARIAAIGTPAASKKEANEAANLQKARDKLALYEGVNSVAALKKVSAAGKFVFLSATDDAAVLAGVAAIVQGFSESADKRLDSVDTQLMQLRDPKHVAVVESAVSVLENLVQKGRNSIQTNPLKASALLITAYDQLGLVIAKAKRLVEAEAGSPPPAGLSIVTGPDSIAFDNAGAAAFVISKIRVFAIVTSNGSTVTTYAGQSAKSLIPGLFAVPGSNTIAAGTQFDLTPIVAGLVPGGTSNPRVAGVFQVTLKGQPFFNVFFDLMPM